MCEGALQMHIRTLRACRVVYRDFAAADIIRICDAREYWRRRR